MEREGKAIWNGTLRNGSGTLTTQSKALNEVPYTFVSRFESGPDTNPEELIGAAHAGCFSMAFSLELEGAGIKPERIETTARVSLDRINGNFTVHAVHLRVRVNAPGADPQAVTAAANRAKENCPVSRLLNAKITMETSMAEQKAA